jgi:anti-sigma regulatory factor (Ser/Thr protein kinase)
MHGCNAQARERAMLLASELVTNAVIHAATPLVVAVALDHGLLRVLVEDDDERAPVMANDRGPHGGFGLHIVEELADRWGNARRPGGGKVVWFEMTLDPDGAGDPGGDALGRELQDA